MISFHQNHFRNFKHFYQDYVCQYWRAEFPGLPIDLLLVELIEEYEQQQISLEDYGLNPPDGTEWVSGKIIEKTGMGFFHGQVQLKFGALLLDFVRAT